MHVLKSAHFALRHSSGILMGFFYKPSSSQARRQHCPNSSFNSPMLYTSHSPPGSRDFLEGCGLRLLIHSMAQINTPAWRTIQVWLCSAPGTPGCCGHPTSPISGFSTPVSSLRFSSRQRTTGWQRLPRDPWTSWIWMEHGNGSQDGGQTAGSETEAWDSLISIINSKVVSKEYYPLCSICKYFYVHTKTYTYKHSLCVCIITWVQNIHL